MVKSTMAMNYTDTSRSREDKTNAIAINNTSQQVNKLRDDFNEFNNHIAVSNNNFSIYKVNTIAKLFSAAINKLNYTLNLINAKKEDIQNHSYSSVISPILESRFGKVGSITNESGIILFTIAKNNAFYYFYEEYPEFNNKHVNSLPEPYKTLGNDIDAKYYDSRIQLASQNNQSIYYMWVFKLWEKGIQLNIDVLLPDILQKPGKFIVMATTIEITTKIPNITNYATIPSSLINYLTSIQNSFNAYSKSTYDPTLGTVYQFGPNSKFNTLKVVSSVDYPQWKGQYIVDSYIPGSNIDMPNIIYQINTELNRSYTGVQDGQIVIVGYALDSIYYTGVVKMVTVTVNGYNGLCYQLQSININELFDRSVKMTGDVRIQGNLDVSRYDGVTIISTDNTRKVTTIQDKVGINQASHEVNGLLDIDNMTQQIVLDFFQNFVPYSLNSYDIIQVIRNISLSSSSYLSVSTIHDISGLFANGSSLFDYTNQCTVFSVPIKPLFDMADINIIHADRINVDGMGMGMGIGKSILSNNYTFKILQQRVKEVNQMKSEIIRSSDNSNIFSFIDLVCNDDKNWYVVSMRAITDIMPMSDINSNSNMLFVMTYINVTNIMVDQSYYTVFTKLFDYVSRECRFMNYVALLFKNNTSYNSSNNSSNNTNRWVDASGKLSNDASGNPLIAVAIKNNEYFSSRLGLLPESYIYLYTLRDDTSGYDNIFTLHESNPQWNGHKASDCWNGDSNVGLLVNIINDQQYQLYNNRQNSIFAVNYVWTSFRKIAFVNLITINNVIYVLGSGFNLNSLLGPTMVVRGDNSVSGNFYVNDSADNNIFKVDNVTKTISNLYKVGIGMSESPKSILHVTDTTVAEIIAESDAASEQYVILNKLARKLREAPADESSFNGIITDPSLNLTQTVNNYFGIYRINQETFLSTDIKVVYHWLYPQWQTYSSLGNIIDSVNNVPLQIIIKLAQNILDEDAIYDGRMCFRLVSFVFGWKLVRIICFKNKNNGNMYLLFTGTNIQNYGIRYNSNNNLQRLYDQRIRSPNILAEIDRRIRIKNNENINPYYNILEGLNSLNILNKKYNSIRMNQFKIDVNINNLFDIKVTKITVPLDTSINDISFGSTINYADLNFNDRTKFANMYTYLTSKYTYIQSGANNPTGDYFLLRYDDLSVDYIASSKCIGVSGSGQTITLILNEFSIQDCINPSLYVNGDTQLRGDLMIGNENDSLNYVSIDSNRRFFGVNTDERFINYSDMLYTTTTNRYTPKHNVYIKNDAYPVMVSERICEDASGTDVSNNDYIKFGTYSALNAKRKSNIYDFSTIASYADKLQMDFNKIHPTDTVTHMRYGPDIAFEVCDKTNRSVELGQIQLTIDGIGASGYLQGGFGVSVNDYDKGSSFIQRRRNIIYVDNSSTLFVKQINLNGGILSTSTDGNNNLFLLWNGKKLLTEP